MNTKYIACILNTEQDPDVKRMFTDIYICVVVYMMDDNWLHGRKYMEIFFFLK